MSTSTDKSLYCRAYSMFLLDGSAYPDALAYGITEDMAEVLRRQCRSMAHKQLDAKAPAVSFTETEARKHAEDMREMAATFCEENYHGYEKVCRVLAQKFDTWRKE